MNKQQKLSLLGAVSAWVLSMSAMQAEAACQFDNVSKKYTCNDADVAGIVDNNPGITVEVTDNGSITFIGIAAIDLNNNAGIYEVINAGNIANNNGYGVLTQNSNALNFDNSGTVTAGVAVATVGVGAVSIINSGTFTAGADSVQIATADTVQINNSGTLTAVNNGIFINIVTTAITIDNSGSISGGDNGININTADTVQINNNGTLTAVNDGIFIDTVTTAITIDNSGSILGDNNGIFISNVDAVANVEFEVVINNQDTISGDTDLSGLGFGVRAENIDSGLWINNAAGATIRGFADAQSAIFVDDTNADAANDIFKLTNAGDIHSNGLAVIALDITKVEIANSGEIIGNVDGNNIFGDTIQINDAQTTVIDNSVTGLIESQANNNSAAIVISDIVNTLGDSLDVNNAGTIQAGGTAVFVGGVDSVNFNNAVTGSIFGDSDNDGDGETILVSGALSATVTNAGLIESTDNQATGGAIVVTSNLVDAEVLTVTNTETGKIKGDDAGIRSTGMDRVNISNAGELTATSEAIFIENAVSVRIDNEATGLINSDLNVNKVAIRSIGSSDDTFRNAGHVVGATLLGDGNDSVNLVTGMTIGRIDGEAGNNDLFYTDEGVVVGEHDIKTVENMELGLVQSGEWHLSSEGGLFNVFDRFEVGESNPANNELPIAVVSGSNAYNVLSIDAVVFQQFANGALSVAVDGANDGVSDRLSLSQLAILDGRVLIELNDQLELEAGQTKTYTIVEAGNIDEINGPAFASFHPNWNTNSLVISEALIYDYDNLDENDNLDTVDVVFSRIDYASVAGLKYYHNDTAWGAYNTVILNTDEHIGHMGVEAYLKNLDTTADGAAYLAKFRAGSGALSDIHNQALLASSQATASAISDRLHARGETCVDADMNCAAEQTQGWLDVRGVGTDRDAMQEHGDFEVDLTSFTLGVDHAINNQFVVGAALSYQDGNHDADTDGSASTGLGRMDADSQTWGLDGYVQYTGEINNIPYYARGTLGYHWANLESDRDMIIADTNLRPGLSAQFDQDTDGDALRLGGEFGLIFTSNDTEIRPYVGLEYISAQVDDFRETSTSEYADLALDVDFDRVSQTTLEGGVRLAKAFENGNSTVSLHVQPYLRGIVSGEERELSTHYAVTDSAYEADLESHDGGDFQAGINLGGDVTLGQFSIGAGIDVVSGGDMDAFTGSLRASFKF